MAKYANYVNVCEKNIPKAMVNSRKSANFAEDSPIYLYINNYQTQIIMTKQMKRLGTLCLLLMLAIVSRADGFKDFSVIVNNQDGTLLTAEEQVQGTEINFGVAVADDGIVSRVAADDASAVATVSGKFHSEHGCTSLQVQAYEASNVKITVGQCTYSPATITVTDAAGSRLNMPVTVVVR